MAGDYEKTIPCFKRAMHKNSLIAEAYFGLGSAFSRLGRYQVAVELFKQALRMKPDFAEAHHNLGIIFFRIVPFII